MRELHKYSGSDNRWYCGRCDMKFVLLEMDRILRPHGYAIIRESSFFVDAVATIAKGMRWGCRKEDTEYGIDKEKILICQKKLWYSSNGSSRWWNNSNPSHNEDLLECQSTSMMTWRNRSKKRSNFFIERERLVRSKEAKNLWIHIFQLKINHLIIWFY